MKEDQDETKQRVTLFLDPGIVRTAKMHAAAGGTSLSRIVEHALLNYIAGSHIRINSIPPIPEDK